MSNIIQKFKKNNYILASFSPILSFAVPFIILFFLHPNSFEETWKGRTYYLFFIWLVSLEMILNWKKVTMNQLNKLASIRTVAFIIALLLPSIYVFTANFLGLNAAIVNLSRHYNMGPWWANQMPLSIEYLAFAGMFAIISFIAYGKEGPVNYSMPIFLLGVIGMIYLIDNLYPNGEFTPFQIFVPTTARFAASVLDYMGYQTLWIGVREGMPILEALDSQGNIGGPFIIAWPCSGIDSLLIYTVTILLFLKKSNISWKQKMIYFMIGASVTYLINILRIVTFFVISVNGGNIQAFHNYYGQVYSIIWIISYPLVIIGSKMLYRNIRS